MNICSTFGVPGASGPADIPAAFAAGVLEDAEFVYPQADLALFVAGPSPNVIDLGDTHYYTTAWQSPATVQYLTIHRPFFERLNARKQQLRLAPQANVTDTRSRNLQAQGQALKRLRDAGLIIGSLPEAILTDLRGPDRDRAPADCRVERDFPPRARAEGEGRRGVGLRLTGIPLRL